MRKYRKKEANYLHIYNYYYIKGNLKLNVVISLKVFLPDVLWMDEPRVTRRADVVWMGQRRVTRRADGLWMGQRRVTR